MTCEEAALALMLGNDEVAMARAERHRATCPTCGVDGQQEVPDRLRSALPSPPRWLIGTLFALGAIQAAIALPWLVGSDPFGFLGADAPATHTARDGAVGIVVAVAALLAAARPRWARPAFHISAVTVVAQVVAGVVDSSIAETGLPEIIHLLAVLIVVLIGAASVTQIVSPLGPVRRIRLEGVTRDD